MKLSEYIDKRLLQTDIDIVTEVLTNKILKSMTKEYVSKQVSKEVVRTLLHSDPDENTSIVINFYITARYPVGEI